jgi:phosphopentomutase
MIGARASPGCELCKRERGTGLASTDTLPIETVAHIQSAGCKAQKKSVIGDHNRCWKYLIGAISNHGEAKRNLEFIGCDKDTQLKQLWEEAKATSSSGKNSDIFHTQKGMKSTHKDMENHCFSMKILFHT